MRRTLPVAVVVARLVTGCSFADLPTPSIAALRAPSCDDSPGLPSIDVVVGLAAIGFGGWATYDDQMHGRQGLGLGTMLFGIPLFVIGAAELGSAGYGFASTSSCRTARHTFERGHTLRAARAGSRARAWELTKRAAAASRAGDCAVATALDPQVRELDPELHETVFLHDVGIRQCLEPAARP